VRPVAPLPAPVVLLGETAGLVPVGVVPVGVRVTEGVTEGGRELAEDS